MDSVNTDTIFYDAEPPGAPNPAIPFGGQRKTEFPLGDPARILV